MPHASIWIRELPFTLVLILAILGVAYTTVSKQSIIVYWELLAPVIGLVCVGAGWPNANDKNARLLLICTQALHWVAFLLVMNLMLLPSVQRILNASATGLSILTLLARHLYRWCACPFLGSLPSRAHHGALRSGSCVDRGIGSDCRINCCSGAGNLHSALLVLAQNRHVSRTCSTTRSVRMCSFSKFATH